MPWTSRSCNQAKKKAPDGKTVQNQGKLLKRFKNEIKAVITKLIEEQSNTIKLQQQQIQEFTQKYTITLESLRSIGINDHEHTTVKNSINK